MLGHQDHKTDNYTEQERLALTNFRDFLKKIIACGNMRGKIHISSELEWLLILYNAHGSHIKSTSFQKISRRFERNAAHKHITPCKHSIWPLFMPIQELNFQLKTKKRFLILYLVHFYSQHICFLHYEQSYFFQLDIQR